MEIKLSLSALNANAEILSSFFYISNNGFYIGYLQCKKDNNDAVVECLKVSSAFRIP